VAVLAIPAGMTTVYLKRHTWGLHGSESVLSANPGRELPAPGDYRSGSDPPTVLFCIDAGTLHLWDDHAWEHPAAGSFPVGVVFHQIDTLARIEMFESPERYGLGRIDRLDWPPETPPAAPKVVENLVSCGRQAGSRR
jgi:hypothetical protein